MGPVYRLTRTPPQQLENKMAEFVIRAAAEQLNKLEERE